jgi:plasmid stability protein
MATLTIKNLPDEIYAKLKEKAKINRRSINSEAIVQLEHSLSEQQKSGEDAIERARKLRSKYPNIWLTDEDLLSAKNEGRP